MLPESPWLRRHPYTNQLFWTDECEEVAKEDCPTTETTYAGVPFALDPTGWDCELVLFGAANHTREKNAMPGCVGGGRRTIPCGRAKPKLSFPDEFQENLGKLRDLLDVNDPDQRLTAVEASRQLRDFATAASLIDFPLSRRLRTHRRTPKKADRRRRFHGAGTGLNLHRNRINPHSTSMKFHRFHSHSARSLLLAVMILAGCTRSHAGEAISGWFVKTQAGYYGNLTCTYYIFFPNGHMYFGNPPVGTAKVDYGSLYKAAPKNCGTYTLAGENLTLNRNDGSAPETHTYTPQGGGIMDSCPFSPVWRFANGAKVEGKWGGRRGRHRRGLLVFVLHFLRLSPRRHLRRCVTCRRRWSPVHRPPNDGQQRDLHLQGFQTADQVQRRLHKNVRRVRQ